MPDAPKDTSKLTFSVGIPTFNQASYLEATLDSLLNQTRPPDEIVVSDHYSTDHTQQVLAKYAGRIRSLKPPPGVNLTGQYNFTLASQTGDWITIFNSDDVAYPHFCEILLRGAARHPHAALIRSGWEQIDSEGHALTRNYILSVPKVESFPQNLKSQQFGPKVNGTAFAIRRDAYQQSGPILESLESLVDWALFLQLTPFGSYVYEHDLLAGYRVGHDGNKFRDRLPMWIRDQRRIFQQVMPLAAERGGLTKPDELAFIQQASRYNCLRYLSTACNEFTLEERAAVADLFHPWVAEVNALDVLQRFVQGETIHTPIPFGRRLRRTLRPYAQKLHNFLRRS